MTSTRGGRGRNDCALSALSTLVLMSLFVLIATVVGPARAVNYEVGTASQWSGARASPGDTITLTADVSLPCDSQTIPGVTYDLNRKTITFPLYGSGTGPYRGLELKSNVTVRNGTIKGGWWGMYSGNPVQNVTVEGINFVDVKCAMKIGAWGGVAPTENVVIRNVKIQALKDPWTIIDVGPGSIKGLQIANLWSSAAISTEANSTSSDGIAVETALDTVVLTNCHLDGATGDGFDVKGAIKATDCSLLNVKRNAYKAWGLKGIASEFVRCIAVNCGYNSMANAGNITITDCYFEGGTLDSSAFNFGADKVYDPTLVDQYGHPNTYGAGGVVATVTNTSFIRRKGIANLITAEQRVVPKAVVTFSGCTFWNPGHPNLYVGPPSAIVNPSPTMAVWPPNFINCQYQDMAVPPELWKSGMDTPTVDPPIIEPPVDPPKPPDWKLSEEAWAALLKRVTETEEKLAAMKAALQ